MTLVETIAVLTLVGYAVYKQTHVAEVRDKDRFVMAIIYAIIGVAVGGFTVPDSRAAVALLLGSVALSIVVGVSRGQLTRVWAEADGTVMRQGTVLTVGLFLGMVAVKFGMGVYAYVHHIPGGGGFGEIMIMVAIMVAVQTQLIHNRAAALKPSAPRTDYFFV